MPSKGLVPKYRVELAIMLAISQGLLERDRIVVNVYGARRPGPRLDTLSVVDVGERRLRTPYLGNEVSGEDIEYQVLSHVLNIALSLAAEGREGKPVGTIFVLGDSDGVAQRSSQIRDQSLQRLCRGRAQRAGYSLEETIKEFAAIDGAF